MLNACTPRLRNHSRQKVEAAVNRRRFSEIIALKAGLSLRRVDKRTSAGDETVGSQHVWRWENIREPLTLHEETSMKHSSKQEGIVL